MKKRVLLLTVICFIALIDMGMAQFEWSNPIFINSGYNPDFYIDENTGRIHIVSMRSGVLYTVTDSLGQIVEDPFRIPQTGNDNGGWQFGPTVAVDNDGYPHICFRRWDNKGNSTNMEFDVYYIRKGPSGWSAPRYVSNDVWRGYVVRMAIDGENRVHIARGSAAVGEILGGPVTYYRIINDQLETVRSDIIPYRADDRLELDVTDDGIVHLILGSPDRVQAPVTYYRSTDGGDNMAAVGDIHNIQCTGRNGCPDVFADKAGNVHFSYGSKTDQGVEGEPSIRYVRYLGNYPLTNTIVSEPGDLAPWKNDEGWGLSSVAASDDGQIVVVIYYDHGGLSGGVLSTLYSRISTDGGLTWGEKFELSDLCIGDGEGRSFPLIRAYKNHFYVVYPRDNQIRMRYMRHAGDPPPVASAGGPYTGYEGQAVQLDMSGSTDEGLNGEIIEYAWDWDRDGTYEFVTSNPIVQYVFGDNFEGERFMRIKDYAGHYDYDSALFTISNKPPGVDMGSDTTCSEGDTLMFTALINDPGTDDTHTIQWDFGGGYTSGQPSVAHSYGDNGLFDVHVLVEDDDGGVGEDSIAVTVLNISPVADAGGPYEGPMEVSIPFSGSGFDPGWGDTLTYSWDLDEDTYFETIGETASKMYPYPGEYTIYFKVEDDDGGFDIDTTVVTVSNDPPVIAMISNQTIFEGGSFSPIHLDDFVDDPDQADDLLVWNYSGHSELIVSLQNRILTVQPPDVEWNGQETIRLIVTDPGNLKDTTDVVFTVDAVNDPPLWSDIPDFEFDEDSSLIISFSTLFPYITDVDDDTSDYRFQVVSGNYIQSTVDSVNNTITFSAPVNWNGNEDILFTVFDKWNDSDTDTSHVTVNDVQDLPNPFSIITPTYVKYENWPDSIVFRWHSTTDPDSGDEVYYEWMMKLQGGVDPNQLDSTFHDTTFVFFPNGRFDHATYLWQVTARDQAGNSTKSNFGIIDVEDETPVEEDFTRIPNEFKLMQNYPNPFNPQTQIIYHLPRDSYIHLAIYNMLGRLVRLLIDRQETAGVHTAVWDGRDTSGLKVPSGLYICRMKTGSLVFMKKMMLVQ